MSNYTTHAASFKATNIDTRALDAKRIDTKKLFINGTQFDPSQIKESPNEAKFIFSISPNLEDNYDEFPGGWQIESQKNILVDEQLWESLMYDGGELLKGSQTGGALPNGVYVLIQINDNFAKCIGGNGLDDTDISWVYNIAHANFELANITSTLPRYE